MNDQLVWNGVSWPMDYIGHHYKSYNNPILAFVEDNLLEDTQTFNTSNEITIEILLEYGLLVEVDENFTGEKFYIDT